MRKQGIKWLLGLSSVALFTGFIGLAEKTGQTSASSNGSETTKTATSTVKSNNHSDQYFSDDSDDNDNHAGHPSFDQGTRGQGQTQGGTYQGSNDNNVDGHSS